jgi:thiosulfate dehydrogenase (quinone) large subunit
MTYSKEQLTWAALRIGMGWIFFWAFIDKLFGLGFATKAENAWLAGGSPTFGFLNFGAHGPLQTFYQSIAGNPVVDVLFMAGLLGIGLALLLGIGTRIAGYSGVLMSLFMYSALILPENNPLLDEHIIYALVFYGLTQVKSGQWIGLGKSWAKTKLVRNHPILE